MRKIIKYSLLGYTTITLLLIAIFVWVYISYLSGPGAFFVNEYHPFRSESAKVEYLEYYDAKAEEWPLDSEERMVSTSYGA